MDSNVKKKSPYWRGYCRVCNRYYFYKQNIDFETVQFHQQHKGVCQSCRYDCAGLKHHAPSKINEDPDRQKPSTDKQEDSPVVYMWRGVKTDE